MLIRKHHDVNASLTELEGFLQLIPVALVFPAVRAAAREHACLLPALEPDDPGLAQFAPTEA
jgi:hypothetical protein